MAKRKSQAKDPNKSAKSDPHPLPKEAEMAKMRSEMLDMRIAGYSFDQIAEEVKLTVEVVRDQLDKAMSEITLPKAEVAKVMMVEQIDRCMPQHFNNAVQGDVGAVHALIALLDRKARLMGLNAPEQHQSLGADGKPINVVPVLNVTIVPPGPKPPPEAGGGVPKSSD